MRFTPGGMTIAKLQGKGARVIYQDSGGNFAADCYLGCNKPGQHRRLAWADNLYHPGPQADQFARFVERRHSAGQYRGSTRKQGRRRCRDAGHRVGTPDAAAVALATVGLAMLLHMSKGGMSAIGR
jgi:hypothetical protein